MFIVVHVQDAIVYVRSYSRLQNQLFRAWISPKIDSSEAFQKSLDNFGF